MNPTTHTCRSCKKPRDRFGVVPLKTGGFRVVCLASCFARVVIQMMRREGVIE